MSKSDKKQLSKSDRLEKRIAKLERDLNLAIRTFNAQISSHERVSWTGPVTRAMRILCDHVGRHPKTGESTKNFPTQKDWNKDTE